MTLVVGEWNKGSLTTPSFLWHRGLEITRVTLGQRRDRTTLRLAAEAEDAEAKKRKVWQMARARERKKKIEEEGRACAMFWRGGGVLIFFFCSSYEEHIYYIHSAFEIKSKLNNQYRPATHTDFISVY